MVNLQLDIDEGIFLQATEVERYGEREDALDEMVLTNKNLICVYNFKESMFSKAIQKVEKIPLDKIKVINTAPLSMLGGNAEDMGRHYLSDEQIDKIESATEADVNVLVISNILSCDKNTERDVDKETHKINELINAQIKYFNLDPEFIINFVNQYERDYRFQFSSGLNVFNIVYESSIRNRIIANSENVDPTIVINVLRELAFYMHFGKKNFVGIDEIINVVETYKNLMMISRVADVTTFSRRAQELNRELENKIEKSIIKYTVREYLLRNNVEIYGEAQSLIDCFFGGQTSQKLKMEIAKKRIIEKDRT